MAAMVTPLERLRPAVDVGYAFWTALAQDDDELLGPLLSSTWSGRPPAFAKLYRDDRGLAAETCRLLGLSTVAELLASDRVRFYYTIADRPFSFTANDVPEGWKLELVEVDGRWYVDRSSKLPALEQIDLGPLFPEESRMARAAGPGPQN